MEKYFPILIQIIHDIIAECKEKEKELSSEFFVTIPTVSSKKEPVSVSRYRPVFFNINLN